MKIASLGLLAALVAAPAFAQQAQPAAPTPQTALQRIELARQMFPPDKYATFLYMVVVAPGGVVGRHTHPGIEMGYMLEGEAVFSVEGQPDLVMTPGVTYAAPAGAIHSARNTGDKPVKIVATFVVEKDKPLATPAP